MCSRENEFVAASAAQREAEERQRLEDAERVVQERDRATAEQRKAARRARWLTVASAGMLIAMVAMWLVLQWGRQQYAQATAALAASHLREGVDHTARGDVDQGLAFFAAAARLNGDSPVVRMA